MEAHCRIGRIKFKSGGELHLLRTPNRTAAVWKCVEEVVETQTADGTNIAGMAFIVWGSDNAATCVVRNWTGVLPTILIPDFVKNRLFEEIIEQRTHKAILDDL